MSTTATPHPSTATNGHAASDAAGLAATAAEESSKMLQKLREKKDAAMESLQESMQPRIDAVSSFARNDPTKAVLISAATGAGLMALIALVVRVSNRPTNRTRSAMATIRDAALDLADRAHNAATDAIAATHERASSAQDQVEAVQKRVQQAQKRAAELRQQAADAASSATDSATETWQSLRDQAAPVIERFRPQIDAVTSYAKEDPTRAALGAAAAGAVLLGLIAMIRRSGD